MNLLTRNDSVFRSLFNITDKFNVFNFLFQNLSKINLKIDGLILSCLNNFFKEINICKKNINDEHYYIFYTYFISLDFTNFKKITDEEKLKELIICIENLLSIFTHIVNNNSNNIHKETTYKVTKYLLESFMNILTQDKKDNSNFLNLTQNIFLSSIISLSHSIFISHNIDIDLSKFISEYFIDNNEAILNNISTLCFLKDTRPDLVLIKNLIIFYHEILYESENIHTEKLPQKINEYLENYSNFLKKIENEKGEISFSLQLNNFYFKDQSFYLIKKLKDKIEFSNSLKLSNM